MGFLFKIGSAAHKMLAPLFLRLGIAPPAGTFYAGAAAGGGLAGLWSSLTGNDDESNGLVANMHVMVYTLGATILTLILVLGWKSLKRTLR